MRWGAAALVLCALGACAGDGGRAVVLEIEHSRFSESRIEVRAGETVTFAVVNDDPIDHELIVGDERVQEMHEKGTEAHHGDRPGEISVAAGGTAETTYTFDEPGTLVFACHLPGHYDYGMRGSIVVSS